MMLQAFGESKRASIGRKSTQTAVLDKGSALLEDVAAVVRGLPDLESHLRELELYDQQSPFGCGTRWPYYIDAVKWLFGMDDRVRCANDRRAQRAQKQREDEAATEEVRAKQQQQQQQQRQQQQQVEEPREKELCGRDREMGENAEWVEEEDESGGGSGGSSGDDGSSGLDARDTESDQQRIPSEGSAIQFNTKGGQEVRGHVLSAVLRGGEEGGGEGYTVRVLLAPGDVTTKEGADEYGFVTREFHLHGGDWCYDKGRWDMRRARAILHAVGGDDMPKGATLPKKITSTELHAFREKLGCSELQSKLLAFKDIGESFIKPTLYWSEGDHPGCAFEVRKCLSKLTEELKTMEDDIEFAISVCPSVFEHAQLVAASENGSLQVDSIHVPPIQPHTRTLYYTSTTLALYLYFDTTVSVLILHLY
jgi:hypothetical protein